MKTLARIRNFLHKTNLEVMPGLYQLNIRGANIFLIAEKELTLIDTGFRRRSAPIIDFIYQLGRSPEEISLVIITHNHVDHAGGLGEIRRLTRAKVAMHRADIDLNRLPGSPVASIWRSLSSVQISGVDIPLEGGETLSPAGGLQVIHTPGHTPGSISLFAPGRKLLIVGDALDKNWSTIRPPRKLLSASVPQAISSARKLAQFDCDVLCFGHGHPFTAGVRARMEDMLKVIGN